MPYEIVRRGGERPWKIIRTSDRKVVGTSKTRAEAVASVRARMRAEREKQGE